MSDEKVWAVVELFGRNVIAGEVSKSTLFGPELLHVKVPATSQYPEFSKFYGAGSIYGVTPVSEEVARAVAERSAVNPVAVYTPELISKDRFDRLVEEHQKTLQQLRQLNAPVTED